MKYLSAKALLASLLVLGAFGYSNIDPTDAKWGWDDYKQLKCGEGYNKVLNYCVKCSADSGKIFDSVTKQCRSCPKGTTYNAVNQTCDCECQAPRLTNPQTKACQCPGQKVFIDGDCKCPSDKPLWNGKRCVACPPGTNFDAKESQCYHCPEGFIVDASGSCQPGLHH